jgi:hypothetical protein
LAAGRLFWRRAEEVLVSVADSLALDTAVMNRFTTAAAPILADVFTVDPLATVATIRDALFPVIAPLHRLNNSLWNDAEEWILQNRSFLQGLTDAERSALAQSFVGGRTRGLLAGNRTAAKVALYISADSARTYLERNRARCVTPGETCEVGLLPALVLKRHQEVSSAWERQRSMLQQQRQAKYDEAERHLSSLAEQGELPASGVVRMMQQLTSAFELVPLGQAVTTAELVDFAQKVLLSAKAACLQGSTCDADLVPSSVLESYRAAKAREVEARRAAAVEACQKDYLTCDLNLLLQEERTVVEKKRGEYVNYPPRWRLPAGLEKGLVGPDTTMYFGMGTRGTNVVISRSAVFAGGREEVVLSYRSESGYDRWSLVYWFDRATGSVLEVQQALASGSYQLLTGAACYRWVVGEIPQGSFSSFLDPIVFVMAVSLGASAPEHPIQSGNIRGNSSSVVGGAASDDLFTTSVTGNVREDGFRVPIWPYPTTERLMRPRTNPKSMNPWTKDPVRKCKF